MNQATQAIKLTDQLERELIERELQQDPTSLADNGAWLVFQIAVVSVLGLAAVLVLGALV